MKTMEHDHRVLITNDKPEALAPLFKERFPDLAIRFLSDADTLDATLAEFNPTVIFAYPGEPVPKSKFPVMINHPSVQWISNSGAGVEHMGQWNPKEKIVTNASGVNAPFLAQYAIAAHMSANIGMPLYARQQRQKLWRMEEWQPFDDRRFCIIGLGNIGQAVAGYAKALNLRVVGTRGTARPTPNVDEVYDSDNIMRALTGAEFVSVHTALTPETRGMISDDAFAAMADGAIFLNASRGAVVDEDALLRALDRGKVKTAVLDVFQQEPLPKDHPLWEHENVIVTPHMADSVKNWHVNNARAFCDNLDRWLAGDQLQNIVDPKKGY
jgi:phosphoglycerate dehydrogenase-like enzyme